MECKFKIKENVIQINYVNLTDIAGKTNLKGTILIHLKTVSFQNYSKDTQNICAEITTT